MEQNSEKLTILHFNDVYNLEEGAKEPVGGVARFKTALDSFKHLDPLIIFSGDLFQPSLLGAMYKGEQMIKPANAFNIDVACFGNHEFDIDLETLSTYIARTNFPWLLSNVKDINTKECIANGREYHIMTKNNIKIGYVGIAEEDWLHLVNAIDEHDIIFEEPEVCATRLNKILREEHKCDLVIALTHMRTYNDVKLAQKFPDFDLILGGHDHVNHVEEVNGTYIIKSGSDFREFNKLVITLDPAFREPRSTRTGEKRIRHKVDVETTYITKQFEQDPDLQAHTEHYLEKFQKDMEIIVGISDCDLETTFAKIRHSEQNVPNFLADIMRLETESDCALLNSGTIRSDMLFNKGTIRMGDVRLMLPYADLVIKVELTGEQVMEAIENSISKYPAYEGRFPAISGISFAFDPKKEPLKRIDPSQVIIRGEPINLKQNYTMASKLWILGGKDGYDVFTKVKQITEESVASELHNCIKRFFEMGHDEFIVNTWRAEKEGKPITGLSDADIKRLPFYNKMKSLISDIREHEGKTYIVINPKTEGRIKVLK